MKRQDITRTRNAAGGGMSVMSHQNRKKEQPAAPSKEEQQEPWVPPPLSSYRYEDIWKCTRMIFTNFRRSYQEKGSANPE